MRLIGGAELLPEELYGGVAAIGNFDGVHRGHQVLLETTRQRAAEARVPWGLITFEPHPKTFFRPQEPVFRLTPQPLKARLIKALGCNYMATLTFDASLASLSPDEFVRDQLMHRVHVGHVVTGYDFHFGKGRKGSPETMRQLGASLGFGVSIVEQVTDDDGLAPFASSAIRDAIRHGHVGDAAHQLGYRWTVMGEVQKGDRRGRTIGFPTINILLDKGSEPLHGIYAVLVRRANGQSGETWQGAGYFGQRPTFDSDRTFLEVFLFNFAGELYGETLLVEFVELIRPDQKFGTIDDLIAQMAADCQEAQRRLETLAANDPIAEFPLGKLQRAGLL